MLNPQGTSASQITSSQTFPSVFLPAYKQGYVLTSSLSPIKTFKNCSLAAVSTPTSCRGSSPKDWLKAFPERCNLGRGRVGKHNHTEKCAPIPIFCTTWSCDEKFQSSWSHPSTSYHLYSSHILLPEARSDFLSYRLTNTVLCGLPYPNMTISIILRNSLPFIFMIQSHAKPRDHIIWCQRTKTPSCILTVFFFTESVAAGMFCWKVWWQGLTCLSYQQLAFQTACFKVKRILLSIRTSNCFLGCWHGHWKHFVL